MRTLLRVTVDTPMGNKAISEGTLPQVIGATMEKIKPEATYFFTVDGCRSCFMVFDLEDPSQIPAIAEPFFMRLNAKVDLCPVMNVEDLQKGLGVLQQNQ